MKLLFHIVRKDAARVRWLWLAWIGVLVAKVGVGVVFERGVDVYRGYSLLENLQNGLVAADLIATYLLAAWLMLEDAPMRANHYARTRPVSRGGMLAAKILGVLLLLGLVPVLVWLPWWIYCDFSMTDCLREAALTLAAQALVALPASLLGSLVDSFRRLLLWTPVWLGALVVTFYIPVMMIATREETRRLLKDPEHLGLWQTRFQIAGGGLLLLCVALVFWQTLRRRPRETVAALTAGWAAATAWVCFSPLNLWPEQRSEWVEDQPEKARNVEVRLASATLVPYLYSERPLDHLWLDWQPNTRPGLEVIPLKTRNLIRYGEDSLPINTVGYYHHANDVGDASRLFKYIDFSKLPRRPDNTEVDERMARARDYHYLREIHREAGFREKTESFSRNLPEELRSDLGGIALHSRKLFAQVEYEMLGLVPLEKSAWSLEHARGLRITRIDHAAHHASINGIVRSPRDLISHPLVHLFTPLEVLRAEKSFTRDDITLVDSWNRKELPIQNIRRLSRRGFVVGGVMLDTFGFQADPGNRWSNGKWLHREVVTDEWFDGLRLAFVTQRETARFIREIVVDPLPITRVDGASAK